MGFVCIAGCAGTSGTKPRDANHNGPKAVSNELHVFAEGACPKLSVAAAGARRFLVYGDHGRVLAGWVPGDHVATAETLAELRGGRAFRRRSLLKGLPTDGRGYVRGELRLGGSTNEPWLVRTSVRYSLVKRGPLFERTHHGYRYDAGWSVTSDPVTVPAAARNLPEVPGDACGEQLDFVPLTWTTTPAGGLIVAGRCDDDKPVNYTQTTIKIAIGAPGARAWNVTKLPDTNFLDGIVNVNVHADSEGAIYVAAYEPFEEPEKRYPYLAHYDGKRWSTIDTGIREGIMDVTSDGQGTQWIATGRGLYRRRSNRNEKLPLPKLNFSSDTALYVHKVDVIDNELWAEARYSVKAERGTQAASVLISSRKPDVPIACDVREPAETALYEVER